MKTTLEFIADVKLKYAIESDYAAAKLLGVSKMTLSHYRNGKGLLGDDAAMKVAELLNLDTGYVLACIASERARKPEVKAAWKHTAEMLYGLAAVLVGLAILPFVHGLALDNLSGPFGQLSSPVLLLGFVGQGRLYIMSNPETVYWALLAAMVILAAFSFPLHNPRQKQKSSR